MTGLQKSEGPSSVSVNRESSAKPRWCREIWYTWSVPEEICSSKWSSAQMVPEAEVVFSVMLS